MMALENQIKNALKARARLQRRLRGTVQRCAAVFMRG